MSLVFNINGFLSIKNSDLNNFTDDKTIASVSNNTKELLNFRKIFRKRNRLV